MHNYKFNLISICNYYSLPGPDNLDNLRKLAEQFQKQTPGAGAEAGAAVTQEDDDEDEVPELVPGETFEAVAEESPAQAL